MKQIQFNVDGIPTTLVLMTDDEFREFCDKFQEVANINQITNHGNVVGVSDINRLRASRFLAYMKRENATSELFKYLEVETDIMTISVSKYTKRGAGEFLRKMISATN